MKPGGSGPVLANWWAVPGHRAACWGTWGSPSIESPWVVGGTGFPLSWLLGWGCQGLELTGGKLSSFPIGSKERSKMVLASTIVFLVERSPQKAATSICVPLGAPSCLLVLWRSPKISTCVECRFLSNYFLCTWSCVCKTLCVPFKSWMSVPYGPRLCCPYALLDFKAHLPGLAPQAGSLMWFWTPQSLGRTSAVMVVLPLMSHLSWRCGSWL